MPKKSGVKWSGKSYASGGAGLFGFTSDAQKAQILGITGGKNPATNAYKRVANDQSAAELQFGSSLRGSIKKQFAGARATAQQQAVVTSAKRDELGKAKNTIGDIASIFKSGMQAQTLAAAAAKARAVQEATGASDSQTAAFAMELAKMKYAARLEAQTASKAAAAAQREAEAQYGIQMGPQMEALQTEAPTIAASVKDFVLAQIEATKSDTPYADLNVTKLQADWMVQAGYTPVEGQPMSAQAQLGTALIQQMVNGKQSLKDAFPAAMSTVYAGAPGYEKWGAPTAKAITASVTAGSIDRYVEDPDAPPDPDIPSPSMYDTQTSAFKVPFSS